MTPDKFLVARYGNSAKPSTSSYYRADSSIRNDILHLMDEGMSNDNIYSQITATNTNPKTVSETIRDPKVVSNTRQAQVKNCVSINIGNTKQSQIWEAELIIENLKEGQFLKVANFTVTEFHC